MKQEWQVPLLVDMVMNVLWYKLGPSSLQNFVSNIYLHCIFLLYNCFVGVIKHLHPTWLICTYNMRDYVIHFLQLIEVGVIAPIIALQCTYETYGWDAFSPLLLDDDICFDLIVNGKICFGLFCGFYWFFFLEDHCGVLLRNILSITLKGWMVTLSSFYCVFLCLILFTEVVQNNLKLERHLKFYYHFCSFAFCHKWTVSLPSFYWLFSMILFTEVVKTILFTSCCLQCIELERISKILLSFLLFKWIYVMCINVLLVTMDKCIANLTSVTFSVSINNSVWLSSVVCESMHRACNG